MNFADFIDFIKENTLVYPHNKGYTNIAEIPSAIAEEWISLLVGDAGIANKSAIPALAKNTRRPEDDNNWYKEKKYLYRHDSRYYLIQKRE
jgi:hypothetical protein